MDNCLIGIIIRCHLSGEQRGRMTENVWAKAKIDSLFFHWLSSEQGVAFVKSLAEDVKAGKPLTIVSQASLDSNNSPQQLRRKLAQVDTVVGETLQSSPASDTASPSGRRYPTRKKTGSSTSPSVGTHNFLPSPLSQQATLPSSPTSSESSGGSALPRIPSFYKNGKKSSRTGPGNEDSLENRLSEIKEIFVGHPAGINVEELLPICKDLLDFPSALNVPLFRRIRMLSRMWKGQPISANAAEVEEEKREAELHPKLPYNPAWMGPAEEEQLLELETGRITETEFIEWWKREAEPFDRIERFFRLVKQPDARYIRARDFYPFVRELIEGHPGLEFLENTPEFQEKYARTVVARIMHRVNTSWTGDITLRELRKSDLLHYFAIADEEEEINLINEYFSYEHFYVIYCKFWELDADHDFLLSREDLTRHGGHSLTKLIVDRIFQQPCRKFTSRVAGRMGFEDFCFFILCEEDKTNATSIRYWFQLVDLDGDGYLRQWEIKSFYDEQLKRMRSLGHEEVTYNDVLCQMRDCLGELTGKSILFAENEEEGGNHSTFVDETIRHALEGDDGWAISMREFLRPERLSFSGSFFNLLFNLTKFLMHESRDPFSMRMQVEQNLTDWDRYALTEYTRLASAEEARGSTSQHQQSYQHASISLSGSGNFMGSDSDDSDDDEDEDGDEGEQDTSDSPRSSEDSGDFHLKGISSSSAIFASANGLYNNKRGFNGSSNHTSSGLNEDGDEDEDDDELDHPTEVSSEDGTESSPTKKRPAIRYTIEESNLREEWAHHNMASLWLD